MYSVNLARACGHDGKQACTTSQSSSPQTLAANASGRAVDGVAATSGTHFTCFTSTKVQIRGCDGAAGGTN